MIRFAATHKDQEDFTRNPDERKLLVDRVIDSYTAGVEGPALVVIADTLGAEFSGVIALFKVLGSLKKTHLGIKGEIIGLAGNIGSSKKVFMDLEADAPFYKDIQTQNNNGETQGYNEANEFVELIEEFERVQQKEPSGTFYLDIKTCPNIQQPYICINGHDQSLEFAREFTFPKVKCLEKYVTDHLGFYLQAKAYTGITLKTGPFGGFSTVEVQEAAIWLALVQSGCLDKKDVPGYDLFLNILNYHISDRLLPNYEVIYKYMIKEDEFFRMVPGYSNFKRIVKGEILAYSDGRKILSEWNAWIFMPLYHTQGQEGFFVLKEC